MVSIAVKLGCFHSVCRSAGRTTGSSGVRTVLLLATALMESQTASAASAAARSASNLSMSGGLSGSSFLPRPRNPEANPVKASFHHHALYNPAVQQGLRLLEPSISVGVKRAHHGGGGEPDSEFGKPSSPHQSTLSLASTRASYGGGYGGEVAGVAKGMHLEQQQPLLVVAGPSGVGKGTLVAKLREKYPKAFGFSVSHTSRPPRTGEHAQHTTTHARTQTDRLTGGGMCWARRGAGVCAGEEHGVHYLFETKERILKAVKEGRFLEHAEVHGNVYGTSIEAVERVRCKGKVCIVEIDVQGVKQVRPVPFPPLPLSPTSPFLPLCVSLAGEE